MSDKFQCPQCGAAYTRERRRIGKAVVCACGHKFLVPPPGIETPPPGPRPSDLPKAAAPRRTAPSRPQVRPPQSSDSSGEVLPLAEVVEPAAHSGAGRWAEPVEPEQPEQLPQAEVVYQGNPYADPGPPGDDLFSTAGAYDDPLAAGPVLTPLPPTPASPTSPLRQPRRERATKCSPRPVGIFLLALLHFFVGAIIMAAGLVGSGFGLASRHSSVSVLVACAIFASLVIAAGVGMFQGMKWIWWLEAFGLTWSICGNAISVLLALVMPLIPGFLNPLLGALSFILIVKYVTRLVFGSLLLAYLFKENVLAFFGLRRLDTAHALGILFSIAITITILLTGFGLFVLRARFSPEPPSRAVRAPSSTAPVMPPSQSPASNAGRSAPANAAIYPITILRATKKATSDDFSMEYEVGRQPLNPASQYIWVVSSPQGKIEFQIPTPSAQSRGQISGKPAQPAGLTPPFTAHIEEQVGGARTRVSNELNVFVGG